MVLWLTNGLTNAHSTSTIMVQKLLLIHYNCFRFPLCLMDLTNLGRMPAGFIAVCACLPAIVKCVYINDSKHLACEDFTKSTVNQSSKT